MQRIQTFVVLAIGVALAFLIVEARAARYAAEETNRYMLARIGANDPILIDVQEGTVTTHNTTFTCCGLTHTTTTTGTTAEHKAAVAKDMAELCDCEKAEAPR